MGDGAILYRSQWEPFMSTNPISEELLAEMLAGLEGVTPGPWQTVGNSITDFDREWQGSMSMEFIPNGLGEDGVNERHDQDAAHIARCDPDTIRAALTELRDRRAADSRANQAVVTKEMVKYLEGQNQNTQSGGIYNRDLRAALSRAERQEPVEVTESDHVAEARNMVELRIVFAGDGGPNNLRFVEVENVDGESVAAGTWMDRGDGLRALALTVHKSDLRETPSSAAEPVAVKSDDVAWLDAHLAELRSTPNRFKEEIIHLDRIRSALVKAPAPAVPDGWKLPITDGLGAVGSGDEPDNPNEFVRSFETSPIMREAASAIEALEAENARLREALTNLEAAVRILPPHLDELGSPLFQACAALGECHGQG